MSLNNIQFPPSAIAGLYPSSLIEPGEMASKLNTSASSPENELHIGDNKKNILIMVNHAEAKFLPDEELSFLTNMLTACKLSLADVAIVNHHSNPEKNYKDYASDFKSRIVFLFDIEPASIGLPISFPHFQIQPFASATFLFAPALQTCNKDALLKSKLWVCLRRIFAI